VSFLRKLFSFLFSKGNNINDAQPPTVREPIIDDDSPGKVVTAERKGVKSEDHSKEIHEEGSSSETSDVESVLKPVVSTNKPVSPPITSTGLDPTTGQSERKEYDPVVTGNTLIDWNKLEIENNLTDINISKPITLETPKTVSPTSIDQPPLVTIKPPKVTSHYTMKICPKTGEHMKEIEVLGEKIDVSSAGCYFDRGELARILGNKPSFLQSVGNFLTGRGNPYEAADRGGEILMLQQEIQKSESHLKTLRLGSPEYETAYLKYKSLSAKMHGINR
jgi:hypothetical protein